MKHYIVYALFVLYAMTLLAAFGVLSYNAGMFWMIIVMSLPFLAVCITRYRELRKDMSERTIE